MTTIEELQNMMLQPYYGASHSGIRAAISDIKALQRENKELHATVAELRKQVSDLTVKKTQVYNPPKPSIGNFSS